MDSGWVTSRRFNDDYDDDNHHLMTIRFKRIWCFRIGCLTLLSNGRSTYFIGIDGTSLAFTARSL